MYIFVPKQNLSANGIAGGRKSQMLSFHTTESGFCTPSANFFTSLIH